MTSVSDNMVRKGVVELRVQDDRSALLMGFREVDTALISDNLARLPGAIGLRAFHRGGSLVGTALTVRTRAGDNLVVHQALEHIRLGDVLVVDGGGDVSRALIGEVMTTIARTRGAAGIIVDGAVRDAAALSRSDFPVYARAANHRGPYKNGPGEINVPVSIGGLVIAPDDVVVGDEDGIVAFPPSIAADLLKSVRRQEAREAEIIRSIQEGSYKGSYSKSISSAV